MVMSDKCKLVDQATFERLQQSASSASQSGSSHKIRNAKYKRMTTNRGFDLMLFMKSKHPIDEGKNKRRNRRVRRLITEQNNRNAGRKGKQRENGVKQVRSRLKKSILRYRQIKKARKLQLDLEEITTKVQELTVNAKVAQIHSRRFREYVKQDRMFTDHLANLSEKDRAKEPELENG